LTNLSIFAYLLIFIYVICSLISNNVLFIQPLAFCWNYYYTFKNPTGSSLIYYQTDMQNLWLYSGLHVSYQN
jgi:hypothetical protein